MVAFMHERHIGDARPDNGTSLVRGGVDCKAARPSVCTFRLWGKWPLVARQRWPFILVGCRLRSPACRRAGVCKLPLPSPQHPLHPQSCASLRNMWQGKFVQNAIKWAAGGKASGIRVATSDAAWSTGVLARLVANVSSSQPLLLLGESTAAAEACTKMAASHVTQLGVTCYNLPTKQPMPPGALCRRTRP